MSISSLVAIIPPLIPSDEASQPVLVSDDGSQTRTLKLTNDGRAYMAGDQVTERLFGSRVGSVATTYTAAQRPAGQSFQPSLIRPVRVVVMVTLSCPLGNSCGASLMVGDDDQSLIEQDKESVAYSGLVTGLLGLTPTLTFQNDRATKLTADLAPGQVYRVTVSKSAGASVIVTGVRERTF